MYAIGSFEPLSSSSSGRRFCLSPCFLLRRMEKTDAESVEDIVEASSSASANCISIPSHGATSHTKPASTNAVMTTPTVASTTPGPMMGFISENFVSIPPVKRIIHKAIIPTNWVISTERYEMKFKPNNMPTPRNSNSAGAPKRYATLPAITATKSSNAPTNTTFSPLMSIILLRLCYVMLYLLCSAWSAACTPGRRTRTPAWLQNCCRAYGRGPP